MAPVDFTAESLWLALNLVPLSLSALWWDWGSFNNSRIILLLFLLEDLYRDQITHWHQSDLRIGSSNPSFYERRIEALKGEKKQVTELD